MDDPSDQKDQKVKKRGRPAVPKKKLVKRAKRRGTYKPKPSLGSLDINNADVAECIFSDDETRAEYAEHVMTNERALCEISGESVKPPVWLEEDQCEPSASTSAIGHFESVSHLPASVCASSSECTHESEETAAFPDLVFSTASATSSMLTAPRPESVQTPSGSSQLSESASRPGSSQCSLSSATPGLEMLHRAFTTALDGTLECFPTLQLIEAGLARFRQLLLPPWVPIADQFGYHLIFVSQGSTKAIQKQIFISYCGKVSIEVHCVSIIEEKIFVNSPVPALLNVENVEKFCDCCLGVVKLLMQFDVCIGANHNETRSVWGNISGGYIDSNPYQEMKYTETCRSFACHRLVELGGKRKRCVYCAKIFRSLCERKNFLLSDSADRSTPNIFLTQSQALEKLKYQHEDIRKKDKKIAYLKKKFQNLLETEGVNLDDELNEDLSSVLSGNNNLSEVQKMFLQEQISCSGRSDARQHRWHPSLIRLALHIKMTSSAAYEALRDSGAVKLPSSRTLFDYSRANIPKEGISDGLINLVVDRVSKLDNDYQNFHVLLCDEMHVSQNLVYRKSDGNLVGYSHLDEVDREWERFDNFVSAKGNVEDPKRKLATTILAYMVKGMTSDVKCVVASYPCSVLTREMLYSRTWHVIERLERSGVRVLAFVCDGNAVNRAFLRMQNPLTKTDSGVVFDTLNFCSPDERPLFLYQMFAICLKPFAMLSIILVMM